jgi:RNA polymerase sigma-70 factor (ECF subfamily)
MTERNSTNHHASLRFSEESARGKHASEDDVRLAEVADLAEARLHARAAQGEVEAIESVWRRNRRWIAAVLAAHAPRGVEIEDLLQEVAATFLAKAREIRDAASVRGWLRVVAVNEARMAARDRGIERKSLARFAASWRGESADRHAAAEARETLELLARLPAQYAEPLLLQAGQGLSQREIAEILDVPETTIELLRSSFTTVISALNSFVSPDELSLFPPIEAERVLGCVGCGAVPGMPGGVGWG